MRIVSGRLKGRQINPPKSFRARPTTDFAKESIFNIISNNFDFEGLKVLDLFAGTGSISYEFVSRGVEFTDSVEKDFHHWRFIQDTKQKLGLDNLNPIKGDAFKFIATCSKVYDLIFADPPYSMEGIEKLPELILNSQILSENGWFILEHSNKYDFSDYQHFKEKRIYGSVNFSIFEKKIR
ncbi:MAG: rRNA (guanine966-N2)-methyltransferase [Tenuifilum sp.]|jgi:16S rRNA (guanine(966)-N(2))-methyltransferase RsmD|uniref:RsmD family RNA methyltransferase n=1 Tax=Tenuifilum sp. TaxID=2760880 RepID=UPI0024AA5D42|nr:RsmD family RNA methyltransferase [Tenuifilum sp.]MDI3527188.1 rRNA (guanine966-N2)-methyltransferase [Tenuifilum sp.]